MEKFVIHGGNRLKGSIEVMGAKNATLPILAASILTREKVIIENVPQIEDVFVMLRILKSMGCVVKQLPDKKVSLDTSKINPKKIDYDLVLKIRSSVFLFAALASVSNDFKLAVPGGCKLGARTLDPHLKALKDFGIKIQREKTFFHIKNPNLKKKNREILLSEMSVSATENTIILSALSDGVTKIHNCAIEPHVQDLCHFLNKMGANISGIGTHNVTVSGVDKLKGGSYKVIPDPIEMVTFISLAAGTKSHIKIEGVVPEFIRFELLKFKEANVNFKLVERKKEQSEWDYGLFDLEVAPSNTLKAVKKVHSMPFPGFSSDSLPVFAVLMTQAQGVSLIHEWMYEGRMKYIDELKRMGADAFICDPHRALITGPEKLEGKDITSFDLRAGVTLIIAALMAEGVSTIDNVYQVDRGYEEIEKRLRKLGAKIKRIKE